MGTKLEAFECKTKFKHGCPDEPYRGSTIYKCKALQFFKQNYLFSDLLFKSPKSLR